MPTCPSRLRPQEFRLTGEGADLEKFLATKLELPAEVARSLAREAEFERHAVLADPIPFDQSEIRQLLRTVEAEARLTATERQQRGKTVQPVG